MVAFRGTKTMNRLGTTALVVGAAGLGAWLLSRRLRQQEKFTIADKVVLITGGSRGLGLVLARQVNHEGGQLAICARGSEELDRAAEDLSRHGRRPLAIACDLRNPEQVQAMVRRVEVERGRIDVLINNAGTICVGPLSTMTREDFEEALAVNFWAAYNTTQAALPLMRQRRAGRIVNISSIGGKVAVPHLVPYCVGKFALAGYSQGLRAELAAEGIVVTTICPGLMQTGSPRNAVFKGHHTAEYTWFSISDALPFITLTADEAARQILDACRHGLAEAILTLPAQVAARVNALFPELTSALLSLTNRLLPTADGAGTEARQGKDCETPWLRTVVGTLTAEAAQRNNEVAAVAR
jgi:NAD(P)-dependent dehydrogenase (short-subunit alcohol dehydrogenase family)